MSSRSESNDITTTKDGGVLKTIISNGTDQTASPSKGDVVFVHYTGTLKETGEKFDSSRDRNEPFKFTLGKEQVIKAWDIGVATMCKGEIATFECRADYAYGEKGSPPKIPGGATLIFDVELIRWEGEDLSPDRDGTITKSIIVEGEKYNCPADGAPITVHIVGQHNSRVFYDRNLTYILGEGSEHQLPEGIDRALRRINKGEKCRVVLKGSQFTFGLNPPPEFGLEANSEIVFTIFLKDFEKIKASWELLDDEKLQVAQQSKERGNAFLSQGKYQLALNKYNSIVLLLEHANPSSTEGDNLAEKFQQMLIAALLNCALVNLKMNETAECIKNCEKVLEKKA